MLLIFNYKYTVLSNQKYYRLKIILFIICRCERIIVFRSTYYIFGVTFSSFHSVRFGLVFCPPCQIIYLFIFSVPFCFSTTHNLTRRPRAEMTNVQCYHEGDGGSTFSYKIWRMCAELRGLSERLLRSNINVKFTFLFEKHVHAVNTDR